VLWIAVQMLVLQRYFFMHPAIAATGVLEILRAADGPCRAGGDG
jgi:hypothetical protein